MLARQFSGWHVHCLVGRAAGLSVVVKDMRRLAVRIPRPIIPARLHAIPRAGYRPADGPVRQAQSREWEALDHLLRQFLGALLDAVPGPGVTGRELSVER